MKRLLSAALLFTSASTLVCCALPALLVTLGAGGALVSLFSNLPQLIWISEHKGWVFGLAGGLLGACALLQLRAERLPCPIDPALAEACRTTRRWTGPAFFIALGLFGVGALFAFALS
jgi:hypothetical protein